MASIINATTTNGVAVQGDNSGSLQLQTNNGTTAVTIDTSQNVGIGTTSPSNKLSVVTASGSDGFISVKSPTTDTAGVLIDGGSTSNKGALLTLAKDGTTKWRIGLDSAIGGGTNNNLNILGSSTDALLFGTNATERMRIASDGGIYLGTTTSNGATGITFSNASDTASYGKSMYMNSPYNGTRNAISFAYNSSGVGAIVTGTSSTSYNSGSDYRLKDNPQPLTGSGAFIDALQPKEWTWKADGKKGVGFIAHEVQEVSPESVFGEKDAVDSEGNPIIQTMEYGSAEFIANIILELQTLRKRVATLEAKGVA